MRWKLTLPLPEFVCWAINYLDARNILLLCYKTGVTRCISIHGAAAQSSTAFWIDLNSWCAACTQGDLSTDLSFTKRGSQSLDGDWVTSAQSPGLALCGAARFSRASQATLDQEEHQQDSESASAVLVETEAILTRAQGKRGDSMPTKQSRLVPVRLKARIPAWMKSWCLVLTCPHTIRIVLGTDGGSR